MNELVVKALPFWGMENAQFDLIAARENQVFRIDHNGESFAMRVHRKDLRTDTEIWSELKLMGAAANGGLHVPTPVLSHTKDYLCVVDGIQIDVLTWLDGQPLGKTGHALEFSDRSGLLHNIGREMARLHNITDAWTLPDGFTRSAWDRDGLLGETPVWDRFWDNPTLSTTDRDLLIETRNLANRHLKEVEDSLDYGLIHADLVRENIMLIGDKVQLIDFDDAGFGFRLFDLATTLVKNLDEHDYPALRQALMTGYRSQRKIETDTLDLFILLRSFTYVGWIISRTHEEGSRTRSQRFIKTAVNLANNYLA